MEYTQILPEPRGVAGIFFPRPWAPGVRDGCGLRVRLQARNATMVSEEPGLLPAYLIIDHDREYTKEFDAVLAAEGAVVQRVGPRAPNLYAHAERFAQTLRHKLLDHFMIFGVRHLRHLLAESLTHSDAERPHQRIGNVPLADMPASVWPFTHGRVRCRKRLGGLLHDYHRVAA